MKNVLAWLLHRVSGLLLILMLIVHFSIEHFVGQEERISYAIVLKRISNPWWKLFDLAFVVLVLYHGFYGLWGIGQEYIHSGKMLKLFRGFLAISVAALLVTGVYIITL
jgi:succinate dehydrogenase membrane anchor subunit